MWDTSLSQVCVVPVRAISWTSNFSWLSAIVPWRSKVHVCVSVGVWLFEWERTNARLYASQEVEASLLLQKPLPPFPHCPMSSKHCWQSTAVFAQWKTVAQENKMRVRKKLNNVSLVICCTMSQHACVNLVHTCPLKLFHCSCFQGSARVRSYTTVGLLKLCYLISRYRMPVINSTLSHHLSSRLFGK